MVRNTVVTTTLAGCALALAAASGSSAADDRAAVEAVVKTAYVDGVHAKGDPALMRQGFHPGLPHAGPA